MAVSNTDNRVQYSITSTPTTSTEYSYPNRVSDVTDIVVQETTQTPRIPGTITFNQSSDQFALTNHGLVTGNVVQFDGTAITGFTADIDYYVVKIDANSFQLATSVANATASPAVVVTVSGTDNVSVTTLIRAGEQPLTRTLTKDSDYTIEATFSGTLITSLTVSPTETALNNGKFAVGSTITIYRETNFQQTSNYVPNQIIPADTLEGDLDKLAMMAQQLKDDVGRSVRFAESVTDPANLEIAFDADQRSGKLLSFDADGNFSVSQEIGVWRSAWQSGRAYSARDLVFNDDEFLDDGTTVNNDRYSIYFAKTAHTSGSSTAPLEVGANWDRILDASYFATQVEVAELASDTAGGASDLAQEWASKDDGAVTGTSEYSSKAYAIGGTGVDGNAGSAKDWATKTGGTVDGTNYSAKHWATQEDVGTVATNISDIRAVAAIDTDVTAVAAIDTAVSAVNANATNINTVAGQITPTNNVSTVAGVSADITAVAGQISPTNNISTVAGIDSDIQTVAGQISPTNNIATVAGISTEIQTVAGDSADIQTVATNILDVNNFADTYLGALASDPSTTLDGALYFNTTSNELRVYDLGTTTWIPITSPPQALDTTDSPTFAGVTVTTADINGGTIDGTDVTVGTGKTLDVSGGTLTTSTAQKEAIVDGGKGNLTASDVGLGNVTNESKATMFTNPTFTGTTTTSAASLNGAVTINDSGADVDFRVEGSGEANALFVDGTNGNVGIGTNSPSSALTVFYSSGSSSTSDEIAHFGGNGAAGDNVSRYISLVDGRSSFGAKYKNAGNWGAWINGSSSIYFSTGTVGSEVERMRIDSSGNVKINNLSASSDVQTDASKNLITTSDARLKNEIGLITESGVEVIKQIIPKYFSWKNDENNTQQLGFFAQDIHPVLPEAAPRALKYTEVGRDENDEPILEQVFDEDGNPDYEWGFTDRPIIAMCVKAIQEQQTIIESQQAQIDALSARLDALENPAV